MEHVGGEGSKGDPYQLEEGLEAGQVGGWNGRASSGSAGLGKFGW